MSCGVERHGQPGPEETHRGSRRPSAHLVDDLLLLGVLLSQAGHLSPQGLVLTATEWVWSTGWIPAATGAEGFHTVQSHPGRRRPVGGHISLACPHPNKDWLCHDARDRPGSVSKLALLLAQPSQDPPTGLLCILFYFILYVRICYF